MLKGFDFVDIRETIMVQWNIALNTIFLGMDIVFCWDIMCLGKVVISMNNSLDRNVPSQQVLKPTFCTNCGAHIDHQASFCPECGARLMQRQENDIGYQRSVPIQKPKRGNCPNGRLSWLCWLFLACSQARGISLLATINKLFSQHNSRRHPPPHLRRNLLPSHK